MIYKEFSSKGGLRAENQDSLALFTKNTEKAIKRLDLGEVFIVADGIGGYDGGKEASSYVCRRFYDYYYSNDNQYTDNPEKICEKLNEILIKINIEMTDPQVKEFEMKEPCLKKEDLRWGTTISVLLIMGDKYFFASCGDSRIYRLSHDKSELLTIDQNKAYTDYFVKKKLSYDDYLKSDNKNLIISYMGQDPDKISIETGWSTYNKKDIFFLSTDGLNQFFEKHNIESISIDKKLRNKKNLEVMEKKLWHRIEEDKASDNFTYILAAQDEDKSIIKAFKKLLAYLK